MAWSRRPDGFIEFVNRRWLDFTGFSSDQALGWGCLVAFHPDDRGPLAEKWRALVASGQPGEIEARMRRHDGEYRWFLLRAEPVRDEHGRIIRWYGVNIDIEDRKRAESLRAAETRTLEMIANGAPLVDILKSLCNTIDDQSPKIMSTVTLMDADGTRLWPVPGRRVPRGWIEAISPAPIAPNIGPCASAVLLKQRVIAADIADESPYREIAKANGIRATWSQPLLSRNQEVLGTFAMFYAEPRVPSESDLRLIEGAAHVAVIAIERAQSQDALNKAFGQLAKSEAELRTIIDAIPQLITVLGPDGNNLYSNQAVLDYTGLTREEVMASDYRARVLHPEDLERLRNERRAAFSRGVPFENEQRARRGDGQYRWLLIQYRPLKNEQGSVIRWYATCTDIHERKQAEERTRRENLALREEIDQSSMFEEIVGSSESLRHVLTQVAKVAPTDSTVLISGETGTGKELIARAIHKRSNRSTRAFIVVNCAAIPQSLIASELFGHEKGAFTGALQRRTGRFEAADGGTIFLDEIGELPVEMQVALLRVLQEREFERIGGTESIKVNVRVLAATNRDLQRAVNAGTFRQDLFYRLNVFPIHVPPLRERAGDIPLLVGYLIDRYSKKASKKFTGISKKTLDLFQTYNWPGNVRELQNVIERAVVLCDGGTFSVDETWLKRAAAPKSSPAVPLSATLIERERELIEAALARSRGRVSGPLGAATKLGIPRQTLESKILSLGIDKHRFSDGRSLSS
jgi:formate hydrogenlyase transcriptional activator